MAAGPRGRYRPLAEINVTPLVDVMLVLLIIFMVTAPMMTSGVSVDLPKTNAQPFNSDSEPLTVSIKADGSIFLQEQPVEIGDLVSKLQAISQNNPERRIFVRGDKDLAYGRIMEVMGTDHPGRVHEGGTAGGTNRLRRRHSRLAISRHRPPRRPPRHPNSGTRRVSIDCLLPAWQATDVFALPYRVHRARAAAAVNGQGSPRPSKMGAAACESR